MKNKKLKIITQILVILIICLVSFVGIYKQNLNKIENKVKGYTFGDNLDGYREIEIEVSEALKVKDADGKIIGNTDTYTDSQIESNSYTKTDEKVNLDENLNLDNYKKVKSTIEERLKIFGVKDYNISLNEENGTMYLQIPENSTTDHTVSNILQVGKFEVKDATDRTKVYLTNADLKKASAIYNTTTSGTTVYLELEFDKNGTEVLKNLSEGDYKTLPEDENETENETIDENAVEAEAEVSTDPNATQEENSNETSSEETTEEKEQKKVVITVDDSDLIETSFDEAIQDGFINLSMGQASTDIDAINDTLTSASTVAAQINTGVMPVTYTITGNRYINSDITKDMVLKCIIGISIITAIGIVILIIKYKSKGILATIAYIGFIAITLLVIRYTNVYITMEAITAGVVILIINYMITLNILNTKIVEKEKDNMKQFAKWVGGLLPVFLISIVFVFASWDKLVEFGMFMFWGILVSVIYNYILTKNMLDE